MAVTMTRIKNDVNGNGRYVVHFLNLNTAEELAKEGADWIPVSEKYELALKRAKKIGGRKYRAKSYGGGIVFQSCYTGELQAEIERITGRTDQF